MAPSSGCQRVTCSWVGDDAPAEGVRTGVLDADGDLAPEQVAGSPARWTSLLPRVRPGQREAVAVARPSAAPSCSCSWVRGGVTRVDEDVDLATQPRLVALEADALLDGEQLVQPAPLDVGRDVVGEVRRGRPGSRRVGRREDLVVADVLEQVQRPLGTAPRSRRRTRR